MAHLDENAREIERLRGELSASTAAIGFLFKLVIGFGGGDDAYRAAIVSKIRNFPIADPAIVNNDWIAGVNRFKDRLSNGIEGDTLDGGD